ncbi:MAG: hypothetical protein HQL26_00755 [Candidatus Omnitrophica bacterium]|nr:hypothetical protein [Candidatus Omnitrophota bacterium]
MKWLKISSLVLFLSLVLAPKTFAYPDVDRPIILVYLSGIGCHNCAQTDPVIFFEWTQKFPNILIFDYEIFKHELDNFILKREYFKTYSPDGKSGVPFIILNNKISAMGRVSVLEFESTLKFATPNSFPMSNGATTEFKDLDLNKLEGKFNIWSKNRVLIPGHNASNEDLKTILLAGNIEDALKNIKNKKVDPISVDISGGEAQFTHAVMVGDWRVQWNDMEGQAVSKIKVLTPTPNVTKPSTNSKVIVKTNIPKHKSNGNIRIIEYVLAVLLIISALLFIKKKR